MKCERCGATSGQLRLRVGDQTVIACSPCWESFMAAQLAAGHPMAVLMVRGEVIANTEAGPVKLKAVRRTRVRRRRRSKP